MQRKTRKIIGAVALIGALAAGGAAFTDSSAIPATVAGFASANISGANANSMNYTFDTTTGSASYGDIIAVNLIFNEDLTNVGVFDLTKNDVIQSAFNGNTLTQNCVVTSYDGTGTVTLGLGTHVTCDYTGVALPTDAARLAARITPQATGGNASDPQSTSGTGATSFAVAVSSPVSTP